MKAVYITKERRKEEENCLIRRQIRICIACGNSQVDEYEFGISCERCGTSFYFGKEFLRGVN